jgi:hypothetical protein
MLRLTGGLHLRVAGEEAHLRGEGTHLFVEVARPREFLRVVGGDGGGGITLEPLRRLGARLHAAGLTLHVSSRGGLLLVAGREAKPGLREGLLGLRHVALGSNRALLGLLLS